MVQNVQHLCYRALALCYVNYYVEQCINPLNYKQLNLLRIVPEQVCDFSSLSIFCLECKTFSRRAAQRLIVLHPRQNIESERKWQTC